MNARPALKGAEALPGYVYEAPRGRRIQPVGLRRLARAFRPERRGQDGLTAIRKHSMGREPASSRFVLVQAQI
jgi:hypothetical protein